MNFNISKCNGPIRGEHQSKDVEFKATSDESTQRLMDWLRMESKKNSLNTIGSKAHALAVSKGFYSEQPFNMAEKIALIHSEISEALEEIRADRMHMNKNAEGSPLDFPPNSLTP